MNKGDNVFCYIVIFLLFIIVMGCAGCADGRRDWEYNLPNNYQVFMSNSSNITIINLSDFGQYAVENFVKEFCYNDRFVGAKRIVPKNIAHATKEEQYSGMPVYYIVDTEIAVTYGPYDESEYETKCAELSITDLGEWIQTSPMPEGAYID